MARWHQVMSAWEVIVGKGKSGCFSTGHSCSPCPMLGVRANSRLSP